MKKIEFDKLVPLQTAALTVLLVIAGLFLFNRMFYQPIIVSNKDLAKEIINFENEAKKLEAENKVLMIERTKEESKEKKTLNIKMQILEGEINSEIKNVGEFMEIIMNPRFLAGVMVDSLSAEVADKQADYVKNPLSLTVTGSFENITSFLGKIDELIALISMDSLSMSMDQKVPGQIKLDLVFTFYEIQGK